MHDLGVIAKIREADGREQRGFEVYVGGGLGTVPYQAKLYSEFLPVEELLPLTIAIARVFTKYGEKRNRNKARIKFLVHQLGIEEFRRRVEEERTELPFDPAWEQALAAVPAYEEKPKREAGLVEIEPAGPDGFAAWKRTNVYAQRQPGYSTVTVALPLGDITAPQLRRLADIARKYVNETVRTTVEQNFVLRWVSDTDLAAVYEELAAAHLEEASANTIADITACPGTDTCKLGIASSRGLAAELRARIAERGAEIDEAVRGLHVKISGCFNSCGQHHVADIGFYGVKRNKNGYEVPHFQVLLGGQWEENAGAYGLAIGAVPSKRIPETVDRITGRYLAGRREGEAFQAFIKRIGKAACMKMIQDLMEVPSHDADPSFYTDWADAREFTVGDMGVGECAGEVVSPAQFQLAACERETFEAQLHLEQGDAARAARVSYEAMMHGAQALLSHKLGAAPRDREQVLAAFRTHFYDTKLFFDRFAQGKFAHYYFDAHEYNGGARDAESARQQIEEAQLFIEAAHSCYGRMLEQQVSVI